MRVEQWKRAWSLVPQLKAINSRLWRVADFSSEMIKRAQACGLHCSVHPALVCALQSVPWESAPCCPAPCSSCPAPRALRSSWPRSPETPTRAQAVVERHPEGVVQLVEGDAAALPMPDASFDAVTIGFGLLHLPRPQLALAEVCRELKARRLQPLRRRLQPYAPEAATIRCWRLQLCAPEAAALCTQATT